MYVERNTKARSYNHYCSGKSESIEYSECVFAAIVIQPAVRLRCGLSGCAIFFTLCHTRHNFHKKIIEHEICLLILSTTF
jgi:hypothetical protein